MQDVNKNALFAFSLRFFRPNLTDVSEEHGERFHQDIQVMEKRYQGRWDEAIMGDLCLDLDSRGQTNIQEEMPFERPLLGLVVL